MAETFDPSSFKLPSQVVQETPSKGRAEVGLGRPKGSVNIASKKASKKLEALGFDPIERMIELYDELAFKIHEMTHDADGFPTTKYSQMALAQLMAAQQRCVSELMRYGYARATEGIEVSSRAIAPITILTTDTPGTFDTSLAGTVRPDDEDGPFKGDDE